jgi:hypothetical protein
MSGKIISQNCLITQPIAQTTAGTSTLTGTVDMSGFDGVLFIGAITTADVTNGLKAGGGAASNGSDASDYAGSKILSDGTATLEVLDVFRPKDRYVTVSQIRAVSTVAQGVWAIRYCSDYGPINSAVVNTLVSKFLADPVTGTA